MTREEHLRTIAMEECAELAQRISKAQRFGRFEREPGQEHSNNARIVSEYCDLVGVLEMLGFHLGHKDRATIEEKKRRVEKFLAYSHECGTLIGGGS